MAHITEDEMKRIFSEAMEAGGPKAPDNIAAKRKAIFKAFEEYLEEVERVYFAWGYRQAIEDMESMKDE